MKRLFLYALSLCTVLLAGCNNGDDGLLDVPEGWAIKAVSLAVTPKTADIPAGLSQQLEADAVLETGETVRVTTNSALTWTSSDPAIATIDAQGLVKGLTKGTVTITAEGVNNDGSTVTDTATITVSDAIATALTVTPKTKTLAKGLTQQYTAEALMSDGRVIDVTTNPDLTWSSSEATVATISNDVADKGLAQSLEKGTTTIKAEGTVNGVTLSDTATLTVGNATVASLEVTPVNASVPVGLEQAFTAEVVLTDGTVQDVTESATWASDDPGTALVSDTAGTKGIALGKAISPASSPAGISATITVAGTTYTDTSFLTVTDAVVTSFNVSPASATVPKGLTQQYTAEATLSDGRVIDVTDESSVSWTSSDAAIASISNNIADKGLATGVSIGGPVTITATATVAGNTYQDTAELTVTNAIISRIQVTPATETTPKGLSKAFTATAILSDGSTQDITAASSVSWSSSDSNIATVSNAVGSEGVATGENLGSVTITATDNSGPAPVSGAATLTVTEAIVVGLQVTPPTETTPIGLTKPFTATAILSDGNTQDVTADPAISWTSSDTAIASVSNGTDKGTATGVSLGTATITATGVTGTGSLSGSATLTVTNAVVSSLVVTPLTETTPIGLTKPFIATAYLSDGVTATDVTTDPAVSWSSSDTAIATVDNGINKGVATGVSVGATTIIATGTAAGNTFTGTATLNVTNAVVVDLTVTPTNDSTPIGLSKPFTASATLSNGDVIDVTNDPAISWTSSDPAIATITSGQASDNGVATGVALGTVTITAQGTANGTTFTDMARLDVTDAVIASLQVTPVTASTPIGLTKSYTATAILSDGVTTIDVTTDPAISWSSSDTAIATVDASGVATGVTVGTTTITASGTTPEGLPVSGSAALDVTNAIVTSLVVTPATESTPIGLSKPFTATAILSDGVTTIDVTDDPAISWTSSDTSIATINTSGANKGEATGEALGTVTIMAAGTTPEGAAVSGSAQLTVTNAVVSSLQVTPPTATKAKGLSQQFEATALMSDGSTVPATDNAAVSWTVSDGSIADITTGLASGNGVATGLEVGNVTVSATAIIGTDTYTGTASFTVTAAEVTSLAVTPATASVAKGLTQQFTATATLTDGTTPDVTNDPATSWTSDNANATVNATGLATGANEGNATITATYNSQSGSATLTVTSAVPLSIDVTPASASVAAGLTQQFTATVNMSDGTTPDITDDPATSWTSSNPIIATIGSSGADMGIATGVTAGGPVTVTASNNGVDGTAQLTVTAAALEFITVTPNPITVGVSAASSGNLTATGNYSDGTTPDITTLVSWTGQNTAIATVNSGVTNGGLVTGVTAGTTQTIASMDDGYGTTISSSATTINVARKLISIEVSPTEIEIKGANTVQLTATGIYDDGFNEDITDVVNWHIENINIANISGTGSVSNGLTSDDSTTANASKDGVNSNSALIYACKTFYGPCIDTQETSSEQIFSSSPSLKAAERYGVVDLVDGFWSNDVAIFKDGNYQAYCDGLSAVNLAGRSNWRTSFNAEMSLLFSEKDPYNLLGWPDDIRPRYRTVDTETSCIDLKNGDVRSCSIGSAEQASCISDPLP
ncbi:Ig-like domain-containing protein [Vibrio parahaemolyticus]